MARRARHQGPRKRPARYPKRPQGSDAVLQAALSAHRKGDLESAIRGYRDVLERDESALDAWANLGTAYVALGSARGARAAFERSLALAPSHARVHRDVGIGYFQIGDFEPAERALRRALELDPSLMGARLTLARLLLEIGDAEASTRQALEATELDFMHAPAYYELSLARMSAGDLEAAIDAGTKAITFDPSYVAARFQLGVALGLGGNHRAAEQQFANLHPDPTVYRGAVESYRYIAEHRTKATQFFVATRESLRFAMQRAPREGLILELGVRFGTTLRWLAAETDHPVVGFDSFEGLPEDWHVRAAGAYSTQGELPDVPPHVRLEVGLFSETLGPFLDKHPGRVALLHIDCDLYSSTQQVFAALGDRIEAGTVIVFDEYFLNDRWREDEFKAFQEAVRERGWTYEYLAASLFSGQAVVRITATSA